MSSISRLSLKATPAWCRYSILRDPANDYNLNIPRYIDATEPEDLHDLDAHLNGGIPDTDIDALDSYWTVFPTLRRELFKANGRQGYSDPKVATQQVKTTILNHSECVAFQQSVRAIFNAWRDAHEAHLLSIDVGTSPKEVVHTLSEEILQRFAEVPLLDPYDVYQRLMNYWDETMQDDVYLIASEGWVKAAQPRYAIEDKNRKIKEKPDLKHGRKKYKMDLLPPALIVARYFADEQEVLEALGAKQEDAKSALDDYLEEHTGDEGLLSGALNDKGNVTKVSVKERLKAITPDLVTPIDEDDIDEERISLERCLYLLDTKSKADKSVRTAQDALNKKVLVLYTTLTKTEIKTLVVEDKWFASMGAAMEDEINRLTQGLAGRVKELEERYAQPLPELDSDVEVLSAKVEDHLRVMGLG